MASLTGITGGESMNTKSKRSLSLSKASRIFLDAISSVGFGAIEPQLSTKRFAIGVGLITLANASWPTRKSVSPGSLDTLKARWHDGRRRSASITRQL